MERIIDSDMLKSAESGKSRAGKKDLIKHLHGQRITRNQAIRAKCFDCNGMGESGECEVRACPLYAFSPYSKSLEPLKSGVPESKNAILQGV